MHRINLIKYNKYKKQYQKGVETIKLFDKLYRKTLPDTVIAKREDESLCKSFTI